MTSVVLRQVQADVLCLEMDEIGILLEAGTQTAHQAHSTRGSFGSCRRQILTDQGASLAASASCASSIGWKSLPHGQVELQAV